VVGCWIVNSVCNVDRTRKSCCLTSHSHIVFYRCGPCRFIAPIFEELAKANPEAEFVKCDVDEADDVAASCGVRAMPTFHFYRNGEKVEELMGADQNKLKDLVEKHK
jgi:thioredoxin 1